MRTASRARLIALTCGLSFAVLAVLVTRGATQEFDVTVVRALRRADDLALLRGPDWLPDVVRDLTSLGSEAVLAVLVIVVAAALQMLRHRRQALLVVAASLGGLGVDLTLKQIVGRPRLVLDGVAHATLSASFPSGHAMLSAIVYLTLGALLSRFTEDQRLKRLCIVTACVLTGVVGISRVALGLHYPSDVVAGWLAGVAWASLCWALAQWLQRRGEVEPPGAG